MITPEAFRAVVRSLPEAVERETWGQPTFRVRERIFAMLSDAEDVASVKASPEEQAALIEADPGTFAVASYVGRFGWVRVRLDRVDPGELEELLVEAWRRTAPRRLVRAWEAGT